MFGLYIRLRFGFVMLSILNSCISFNVDNRLELADILPKDVESYDNLLPPVVHRDTTDKIAYDPAIVLFSIHVMGIDSINEASMTYTANIFVVQKWNDYRLQVPNMTQKYRVLDVEWLKRIWHPESCFRNAKSIKFQKLTVPNHFMLLYPDKSIKYSMKLTLELSCAMDFTFYPHDMQECKIQIETLYHPSVDLIFQWDTDMGELILGGKNIQLPQLVVIEAFRDDCTHEYANGNYSCLEVVFILKRNMGYYLINTYIPTCLIVIVSWISFWIKPEAIPARITLGVTSLLTLLTQHSKSQEALPHVSYLKMVDAFMLTSTVYVFMVLMEFCLVTILLVKSKSLETAAKKGKIDAPSENWMGSFFIGSKISYINSDEKLFCPAISRLKTIKNDSTLLSKGKLDSNAKDELAQCAPHMDRASRILFPVSFIFLNCIYWLIAFYPDFFFAKLDQQ